MAKEVYPFIAMVVVALPMGKFAIVRDNYPLWVVAVLVGPTAVSVLLANMDFLRAFGDMDSWRSLIAAYWVTVKDWPTLLSTVVVWATLIGVETSIPPSTFIINLETSVEWLMVVSWVVMMCVLVLASYKLKWNSSCLLFAYKWRLHLPPVTLLALVTSICVTTLLQEARATTSEWSMAVICYGLMVSLVMITIMQMTWNSLFVITKIKIAQYKNKMPSAPIFPWRISAAIFALISLSLLSAFDINKKLALAVFGWTIQIIYWLIMISCIHNGHDRIAPLLAIDIGNKHEVISFIKDNENVLG